MDQEQIIVPAPLKQWVEQICEELSHSAAQVGIHLHVLDGTLLDEPGHMILRAEVVAPYNDMIPIAPCIQRATSWSSSR